jgi:hypothetical protein
MVGRGDHAEPLAARLEHVGGAGLAETRPAPTHAIPADSRRCRRPEAEPWLFASVMQRTPRRASTWADAGGAWSSQAYPLLRGEARSRQLLASNRSPDRPAPAGPRRGYFAI